MIKSITVTNHLNEELTMVLSQPDISGINVKKIEGLGPPKASINSTKFSTSDGDRFTSSRVESRNIVLTLGFLFMPTVEAVRLKVYDYFPIKKRVKLQIETDAYTSEIYGYVESNTPDIFSKDVTSVISIVCPDPYFYSVSNNTTIFSGIEPMFHFPFSNLGVTEPTIAMSLLRIEQEQTVVYQGDTSIGITIYIHAIGPVKDVTIYNLKTRESMTLISERIKELSGDYIKNGDDIIINTVKGYKSVTLYRDGKLVNILNCLDKNADWFTLSAGDNVFVYTTTEGDKNLQFKIENRIAYEGL